jgi:hypothetical protein
MEDWGLDAYRGQADGAMVPRAGVDNFVGNKIGRALARPQGTGHGWPVSAGTDKCRFDTKPAKRLV